MTKAPEDKGSAATRSTDLEVRSVPIDSLILDPRNARKHNRRNLDAIKGSLTRFGQRRPLVVMSDMTVIAGNGTLQAARDLGWTEIAVTVVPEDWTADEAKAYALADNRTAELAEWDDAVLAETLAELDAGGWDLNSIGFDGLPELRVGAADDEVPDPPKIATTKPGDVWVLGEHRIVCASSTDADAVGRLLGDDRVAAVITDPPYGVDYVNSKAKMNPRFSADHREIANDALKDDALEQLLYDALSLSYASAAEGAAIYVFHSDARRIQFEGALLRVGWHVHQTLVWIKQQFVLGMLDYHPQHEPILYGWKPAKRHAWYGGRKRAALVADEQPDFERMERDQLVELLEAIYGATTVVREDRPQRSEDHPTMKPVGLLSRLIVNSTKKGGIVYDPFLGSGSTLIACERQGRVCYGVELDPIYCDVIRTRWESLTGQTAVLEEG